MPKFSFLVRHGAAEDHIQTELSSKEAAWSEAVTFLSEILKEINGSSNAGEDLTLFVADETGRDLFEMQFSCKWMVGSVSDHRAALS